MFSKTPKIFKVSKKPKFSPQNLKYQCEISKIMFTSNKFLTTPTNAKKICFKNPQNFHLNPKTFTIPHKKSKNFPQNLKYHREILKIIFASNKFFTTPQLI